MRLLTVLFALLSGAATFAAAPQSTIRATPPCQCTIGECTRAVPPIVVRPIVVPTIFVVRPVSVPASIPATSPSLAIGGKNYFRGSDGVYREAVGSGPQEYTPAVRGAASTCPGGNCAAPTAVAQPRNSRPRFFR